MRGAFPSAPMPFCMLLSNLYVTQHTPRG